LLRPLAQHVLGLLVDGSLAVDRHGWVVVGRADDHWLLIGVGDHLLSLVSGVHVLVREWGVETHILIIILLN
jgi:hypothetical protein